jgi:hypothetical protein
MIKEINIKEDYPIVDVAIARIQEEIDLHKKYGEQVIKIIHGYGSHGVGGKIKQQLDLLLPSWKKKKYIFDYIKGESFTFSTIQNKNFDSDLKDLLLEDCYFSSLNKGVTILILRKEK